MILGEVRAKRLKREAGWWQELPGLKDGEALLLKSDYNGFLDKQRRLAERARRAHSKKDFDDVPAAIRNEVAAEAFFETCVFGWKNMFEAKGVPMAFNLENWKSAMLEHEFSSAALAVLTELNEAEIAESAAAGEGSADS